MRIVLDLQGAQNDSRFRGIGRYSLSLAREMVQAGSDRHEFHLLLNRNLPGRLTDIGHSFAGLLPRQRIHVLELPHPSREVDPANLWRNRAAALVREAALHDLHPDLVHISSLVEGFSDHSITSIGALGEAIPTAITLYDLIPLLRPDTYLIDPPVRRWYYRKAQFARRADLLLAISASSAAEAEQALSLPPGRVVTIGTGVEDKFRPVTTTTLDAARLCERYRLQKPFVLYAGAADPRKNLSGLMRGFALLPAAIRAAHCLAIVGRLDRNDLERLANERADAGLGADEVVFLGFVPDDDLICLYGLCAVLAFPSFHEGFGLPAAEAMACGAAVIGSNRTSVPEVIGRADALFDPADPASIAALLARVLSDAGFRDALRRHGPPQAGRFTWPGVAERALAAFEKLHAARHPPEPAPVMAPHLPRVAYVSPLPPDHDTRARHAARLLVDLSMVLDLTCIAASEQTTDAPLDAAVPIRSHDWLCENRGSFDHVIVSLADGDAPSAVAGATGAVLHDATLSGVLMTMQTPDAMALLQAAHGWHAVLFARDHGMRAAQLRFDCLLPFLVDLEVVITHSPALAGRVREAMHGRGPVIISVPPASALRTMPARATARDRLGLAAEAFVVASLVSGSALVSATVSARVQRQAVDAWRMLTLDATRDTLLLACGDAPAGAAEAISGDIARFGTASMRLLANADALSDIVAAADLLLHLTDLPAGVGAGVGAGAAAAVLLPDILHAGVPVITSDPAAWSALPETAIVAVPPDAEPIAAAIARLHTDAAGRERMAAALRTYGAAWLAPGATAAAVRDALEAARLPARRALHRALADLPPVFTEADRALTQAALRANQPPASAPRLFIDMSVLAIHDAGSGIQRVCRSIITELLLAPPAGYRVEPIRWIDGDYVFARRAVDRMFRLGLCGPDEAALPEAPVHASEGDIYLGVDLIMETIAAARPWLEAQRLRGMRTVFVLYDLLPFQRPAMFPAHIGPTYRDWITIVAEVADGVAGISHAVMQEMAGWLRAHPPRRSDPLRLGWFHLGGDMDANLAAPGLADEAMHDTSALRLRRSFLSVGTMEPRKGYRQALAAFEAIWASGVDVNYVIVGGRGWMDQAFVDRLETHPELGERLFWFRGVSDATLALLYRLATALLVVSEAEGFGLPLVEAAKFGLPIIARDIPVFREVTGGHASFFDTLDGPELAADLAAWLQRHDAYAVPGSEPMPPYTWRASAARLVEVAIDERWSLIWRPGGSVEAYDEG